mmetsp:Transcript_7402/g.18384  ORF Transcript_7402/g.18384 Transcript_7402/m.18384 type:complete len:375 (-) Transcript_7402:671-1795(-)
MAHAHPSANHSRLTSLMLGFGCLGCLLLLLLLQRQQILGCMCFGMCNQVLQRLHLRQPADGAVLCKAQVVVHHNVGHVAQRRLGGNVRLRHHLFKQVKGRRVRRDEHAHPVLVHDIDERDEAVRLRLVGGPKHGHAAHGQRVEALGDGDVVGGSHGPAAQVRKPKQRGLACGEGHVHVPPHAHVDDGGGGRARTLAPALRKLVAQVSIPRGRGEVEAARVLRQPPVVGGGRHVVRGAFRLEPVDEGHEQRALQPVLVQLVGVAVGGGHQHHAPVPQPRKQARQDHGVSHVRHKELVKRQHARVLGGGVRHAQQRVGVALERAQLGVHVQHEVVEVRARDLELWRRGGHKQVHEHRLAAPHAAVHVQPPRVTRAR